MERLPQQKQLNSTVQQDNTRTTDAQNQQMNVDDPVHLGETTEEFI